MHVFRPARSRYRLFTKLFKPRGTLDAADLKVSATVAHHMNEVRDAARFPESAVSAGELYAAGIIEEVLRAVVGLYEEENEPQLFDKALHHLNDNVGGEEVDGLLGDFTGAFPPVAVLEELLSVVQYLDSADEDGTPHREGSLEELLMLRLGNENPANVRFRELFDDAPLEARESYDEAIEALESFFEDLDPVEA
ncbi:MAG: alpha-amylase, partial [Acidimicrobiia bacterium]|nr:alpha-amylase [Acidimicrobiia bacterium]